MVEQLSRAGLEVEQREVFTSLSAALGLGRSPPPTAPGSCCGQEGGVTAPAAPGAGGPAGVPGGGHLQP